MTRVATADEAELIERMNRIRNASEQHVAQFHHEVERLKDWREHVRAQPLLAVCASAVVGYILVSKVSKPREKPRRNAAPATERKMDESTANEVATTTSLSAGAMAFVGSLASSALRMAATHYVRSALDKRMHLPK